MASLPHLSALPNRVLDTVGVLALTVAARRALFDEKSSVHLVYILFLGYG